MSALNNLLAGLPFMTPERADILISSFWPMVVATVQYTIPLALASFASSMAELTERSPCLGSRGGSITVLTGQARPSSSIMPFRAVRRVSMARIVLVSFYATVAAICLWWPGQSRRKPRFGFMRRRFAASAAQSA